MRLDDQPEAENDVKNGADQQNAQRKPARGQRSASKPSEQAAPMGALGAALLKARGGK